MPRELREIILEGANFCERDFRETLDGGQAFRWNAKPNCIGYEGIFGNLSVELELLENGNVRLIADANNFDDTVKKTFEYLDLERNYEELKDRLESISHKDPKLHSAFEIHKNLRILKQSPQEAIQCFICSSSKRIVQIKQCVALLAEKLGSPIGEDKFSLPSFERIAESDIQILRECKLGFRAEYLKKTSEKIVRDKFDTESLREIPYLEAKKYLTSLSGIGDKVADCILLFGAARFEAFPVDTWIKKAMHDLYNTREEPREIRAFAAERFGNLAGYAQQVIFAAKRKNLI